MGWRDSYHGVRAATVAMQWFGQHVSTTESVFSVWSIRRLHNDSYRQTRVEAGSNTSTVTLRVVGGDEKGSLRSETVKYGSECQGARTRE
jgi:hypothetical protein